MKKELEGFSESDLRLELAERAGRVVLDASYSLRRTQDSISGLR